MKATTSAAIFLTVLLIAAALVAEAEEPRQVYRVGVMFLNARPPLEPFIQALEEGLRDRGYRQGRNLAIEYRFADGRPERLPALAAELARFNVDVFVVAFNLQAEVARQAAPKIPIVLVFGVDPVAAGLAKTLAHPGGTVTGLLVNAGPEIIGKNLELLKELLPQEARIGILYNAASQINATYVKAAEDAAPKLGLRPFRAEIRSAEEFERAFALIKQNGARAVFVLDEPLFYANRHRVNDLALRNGLVTAWPVRPGVDAGGLMSYGADLLDLYRRAATYVDRILKGAVPADLPMEQPTKFELVINLKTARTLGLGVPPSLLLRANQVIE